MNEKYSRLKEYLKDLGSVCVAFSGGADSAFLLKAAHDALGDRAAAVIVSSPLLPHRELDEARQFCLDNHIRHAVRPTDVFKIGGFAANPPNRCYLCKKNMFNEIKLAAAEMGIKEIAEGSNTDDDGDYRPGLRAGGEMGIKSPLRRIGFTKSEVREMSRELGLPFWNKPAFACLASRFPYGESITPEGLGRVERAEILLGELGICQRRVRIHGDIARIEVLPRDFDTLIENRALIAENFREYGFSYAAMDLLGYRMGSLNDSIKTKGAE